MEPRDESVLAADIESVLDALPAGVRVLSLDCFDTILWRSTTAPSDVFFDLQHHPAFQRLGLSAKLRIAAEAEARHLAQVRHGHGEVGLRDIYRAGYPQLSEAELEELTRAELEAEKATIYAFPGTVALIRGARARGLSVVVVSDTYFSEREVSELLAAALPTDARQAISRIFCSSEQGVSKTTGLFSRVLSTLGVPPGQILHLGDNREADFQSPARLGIFARHLVQFDRSVAEVLRLSAAAASVLCPELRSARGLPSPFHGALARRAPSQDPAELLGALAAGPILYAFARFVLSELEVLRRSERRVKVAFLMRDAHLPREVCNAIAGSEVGAAISISRFAALASSFRSAADVEWYLGKFGGSGRLEVMARQLQLPEALAKQLIGRARRSRKPELEFARRVLERKALQAVFEGSRAYRQRLFCYLQRELDLSAGDTLVFVDLGYEGTAQRRLAPVMKDELGVEVVGRYLLASRVFGGEASRKGLIEPSWCEDRAIHSLVTFIALLEDLCSADADSVVDYTPDGQPIGSQRVLPAEQYAKVEPIQRACVDFARTVERFLQQTGRELEPEALRTSALAALGRLLFFPTAQEIEYLESFRLDMNLATEDSFRLFDREQSITGLRRRGMFFVEYHLKALRMNYPIELRAAGLELSMTMLSQLRFSAEFARSDLTLRHERVAVLVGRGAEATLVELDAYATHDGFHALVVPVGECELTLGVLFGRKYSFLQLESIELIEMRALYEDCESQHTEDLFDRAVFEGMKRHAGGIVQCGSPESFVFVAPSASRAGRYACRIVFRPLARRDAAPAEETRNAQHASAHAQ